MQDSQPTLTLHEDVLQLQCWGRAGYASQWRGWQLSFHALHAIHPLMWPLRRLGSLDSLGSLVTCPNCTLIYRSTTKPGKRSWCSWQTGALGAVSGLLQNAITANHSEAQLEYSGNPVPIAWPSF